MKRYFTLLVVFLISMSVSLYSLDNFDYTGIAFDGSGALLTSTTVSVNIQIINGSGHVDFEENHTGVTTDEFGAYTITVGTGTAVTGPLSGVSAVTKDMKIKTTTNAGGSSGTWVVSSIVKLKAALAIGSVGKKKFWTLNGNAGIDEATNFMGTTDDKDVIFKRNNTEAMRIDNDGKVGIGTDAPYSIFDVEDELTGEFKRYAISGYDVQYLTMAELHEIDVETQGTAGGYPKFYYGAYSDAQVIGTSTANFTRLIGSQAQVDHLGTGTIGEARGMAGFVSNFSTGTITNAYGGKFGSANFNTGSIENAYGVYASVDNLNSYGSPGNITNAYTFYAKNNSNPNTTNKTGVTIEEMTGATHNTDLLIGTSTVPTSDDYAMYSASTRPSYFAGRVGMGTDAPDSKLHVFADEWTNHPFTKNVWLGFDDIHPTWQYGYGAYAQIDITGTPSADQFFASGFFLVQVDPGNTADMPASPHRLIGVQGQVDHYGTGNIPLVMGCAGTVVNRAGGSITDIYGGYFTVGNIGGGTITNAHSVLVNDHNNPNITNKTGITIAEMTGATNNTDLLLGTAAFPSGDYAIYSASTRPSYFAGDVTANGAVTINDVLKLTPRATAPSSPTNGTIYYNSTDNKLYLYANGAWVALN